MGKIDTTTEFDFEEAPGRARRLVKHGDIIWSCVRPNRKSYAFIWNPMESLIVSTGFAVISPKKVPTSFLYCTVSTDLFVGYLTNRARGAAYPAVSETDFEEAEIVVPTDELARQFDEIICPTFDLIANLTKQNAHLKTARDLLLPRLMSGEIEVGEEASEK